MYVCVYILFQAALPIRQTSRQHT